jgi:hypothetical protein
LIRAQREVESAAVIDKVGGADLVAVFCDILPLLFLVLLVLIIERYVKLVPTSNDWLVATFRSAMPIWRSSTTTN